MKINTGKVLLQFVACYINNVDSSFHVHSSMKVQSEKENNAQVSKNLKVDSR